MGKIGVFCLLLCAWSWAENAPLRTVTDEKLLAKISKGSLVVSPKFSKPIAFGKLTLNRLAGNRVRLSLDGAKTIAGGELPELPVLVKKYAVTPGKRYKVRFENLQLEELDRTVRLQKLPREEFWGANPDGQMPLDSATGIFPGHYLEAHQSDAFLTVKFFPVQYEKSTGKIIVVKAGDLLFEETKTPAPPPRAVVTKPSLIVTSEKMLAAATLLQKFHKDEFELESEIVTVETIGKTEAEIAETELPDGYKSNANDMKLARYDYSLARKIKNYLEKRFKSLKSVTLLGTAEAIPPSYYFSVKATNGKKHGVTDLCYGASETCFRPEVAVGRLPFANDAEVGGYLQKVRRWREFAAKQESELALFGGKPFYNPMFLGELGALRALGEGRGDWRGVKKYFRTLKNYTRRNVLDQISDGGSSFVFMLDHGDGNIMHVDGDALTAVDVGKNSKEPSTAAAFWASMACTNGAFDEALLSESVYLDEKNGKQSVGVAMLLAKNGAVGYLGQSRPALGVPVVSIDKYGNLDVTGSTFALRILDTFYEKYAAAKKGTVGETLLQSLTAYVSDFGTDMESERSKWSYLNTVYLGDPALVLPGREVQERGYKPAASTTPFAAPEDFFPVLKLTVDKMLELTFDHEVSLRGNLFRLDEDGREIEEGELNIAGEKGWKVKLNPTPSAYFVRLENQKGLPVERQLWFETSK